LRDRVLLFAGRDARRCPFSAGDHKREYINLYLVVGGNLNEFIYLEYSPPP
jgi:hypothetical protein